MKLSLTAKIFIAFLLTSIMSLLLMLASVRYFTYQGFQEYVHQRELNSLKIFAEGLGNWFGENQSWERLREDPALWRSFIHSGWLANEHSGLTVPSNFDQSRIPPEQHPPDRLHGQSPPRRFRAGQPPPPPHGRPSRRPPPPQTQPSQGPSWDPMRLAPRVAVFDMNKNYVAGQPRRVFFSSFSTLPILSSGNQVGWLGLEPPHQLTLPQDQAFISRQTKVIYVIGGSVLALTVIIAWLLSRHMLTPVRKLAAATRDLRARRFETRIPVESSDELGQLARDFNSMAFALARYEDLQQQWLSDISHELRTPLAVLLGEIEAMQDGVRKPDAAALASLKAEARRLNRMVDDVHQLSLAESGGLVLHKIKLDPGQLLVDTVERFRHRLEHASIDIKLDISTTGSLIKADEDSLSRLFSNLLRNVLKHAATPGVLRVWQTIDQGTTKLCIEDSGPGVPIDSLPKLFDRLYRVDPSRSRSTGGSGLGLAICKTIVESHGGTIRALNAKSGGLLIEMVFPKR
jgi:two-component system sensor histidine kinase BaeS